MRKLFLLTTAAVILAAAHLNAQIAFQGFETGIGDWTPAGTTVRVPSGGGVLGLTSASGNYHAEMHNIDDDYLTGFGDSGYSFFDLSKPEYTGDFSQSISMYVKANSPLALYNGPGVWIDATPTSPSGNYGGEHNFRLTPTGTSMQIFVDGQSSPIATLTTSGWYTFQMTWRRGANATDLVASDMRVYDATNTLLGSTVVMANSPAGPLLSQDLGGPGYVWITVWPNGWNNDVLAIDNVRADLLTPVFPFISSQTLGPLRNNYNGFVGFQFKVASTPVMLTSLGRYVVAGNTGNHLLKLVNADGTDVPGASVTVATAGAAAGKYKYALLAHPVALLANTSYFLMSQELAGGDQWNDYGPVSGAPGIASVTGPAYVDAGGKYVTVSVLTGNAYVPLNFLYAPPVTTLTVNITSPTSGTVSGTVPFQVSTTGPVTGLQFQVDGANQGGVIPVSVNQGPNYTINLDTTLSKNGAHSVTVVATDASSDVATAPPVSLTFNNAPGGSTPFVIGQNPGPLRNNYSGFVGLTLTTNNSPVVVASLGRYAAPGNAQTHLLKLVQANGVDVPGGSVTVNMASSTPGTFVYGSLAAGPFTLQPNTTYFVVSQETFGGDRWYDYGSVQTTSAGSVVGPVYTDGSNHYVTVGGLSGRSYVPVNFLYGTAVNTLSATITSPQSGALISGANVQVSVNATGSFTSLQLQVDGVNKGAPAPASPLTLDTTTLSNGQHALSVVVSDGVNSAVSPSVAVTVNNGGGASVPLVTGATPSTLRNNYSGFVGMGLFVGSSPLSVTQLGRYVSTGNSGTHLLKLVKSDGTDVVNGSVTVNLAGKPAGTFVYGALPATVVLSPNTSYYLVSQETAGADLWYDLEPVTTTGVVQVFGPTYTDGGGHYVVVSGFAGYSYVPVNLTYQ